MKPSVSKEKLVELLIQNGKIDAKQVKELTQLGRAEKKSIFSLFMERDILKEEEMVEFLGAELEIPTLNLGAMRVPKEVIQLIPRKIAERHHVVPISHLHRLLTVATSDPFDLAAQDDLRELTQCELCWVLVSPKMISTAIDSYYTESSNLDQILSEIDEENLEVIHEKEVEAAADADKAGAHDAPVVRMVNLVLSEAIQSRASDIHFEPYEKHFRIRYRIDGSLKESFSHSRELYASLVARIKIVSLLDITEKRLPQDGRFRVKVHNREIDLRVSILPTYYGEKVVLRVLDKAGVKAGLDKLGFGERPTKILADAVKRPYGMILVTGPTGSGKSTTLYTILSTLNTLERNLMTVEDPIEYQIEGITQTQVQPEVGLTFANGLRSLLRQSPDIVLVGEIRDGETADIGVKAALTGHLVFSTLHTNSAAGAVTRLIDMGVEPFLIASSIVCVAAQRLMRRICLNCKNAYEIPEDILRRAKIKRSELEGLTCYKGKGCNKCNNTGYYGRLGAIEVLPVTPHIRDLVIQRKSSDVIQKVAVEQGMETLAENALSLFKKGITSLEEVLRVTSQG